MEKVIKSVQTIGLSGMKKSKINEIKIMGMSLPVYIIAAFVILYAAMTRAPTSGRSCLKQ